MVNPIINVRRSSICWRGRRELITDVRKPEIMVMGVIVGGELFTDYSDHPRKLVTLNPKLKSTGAGRYQLLSRWWDAYLDSLAERLLSKKSDAVALQQIKERGALPMIDRGDIRQANRPLQQYLTCRALVMVSSSIRLTADYKIQRSGRNGQRD